MVLIMKFFVDGACRGNGQPGAIGAAAAARRYNDGRLSYRTRQLNADDKSPTNQRAEILAIILALEWAMDDYENSNNSPRIEVTIHSDSQYAVNCMNERIPKWLKNGWTTAAGGPVANQDILRDAITAQNRVKSVGDVKYIRVQRKKVHDADRKCNEVLNDM
jgi:ribonuclease HI